MPRTILVVDDNPMVRSVLRSMLESRGYSVLVASDGVEGLSMFVDHFVDAALVDVDMPRMDGVQACRAMHRHAAEVGRPARVWLMTGVTRPNLIAEAAAAGANRVLSKPFTTDELVKCFEREFQTQAASAH